MQLKCSARIHEIYAQESEKLIEEDRPRILASGRSPDMNMYPFDQPGDADEHNELFLIHSSKYNYNTIHPWKNQEVTIHCFERINNLQSKDKILSVVIRWACSAEKLADRKEDEETN